MCLFSPCIPEIHNSKCFSLVALKIFKTCMNNHQKFIKTGAHLYFRAISFKKKLPILQKMFKKGNLFLKEINGFMLNVTD